PAFLTPVHPAIEGLRFFSLDITTLKLLRLSGSVQNRVASELSVRQGFEASAQTKQVLALTSLCPLPKLEI
ncbi:hypothetical protein, partial [Phormidesmis priestleyi]|uniref:hypothetical protein n=1 Tax=Phormidesmis priestleyi TaxID=268141 RepID=UPI001C634DD6